MKSIRLNESNRLEIIKSMCDGFTTNWFTVNAPSFTSKNDMIKEQNRIYTVVMEGLWDRCYAIFKPALDVVPDMFITPTRFSVAVEGGATFTHELKGRPGKITAGADMLITHDEYEAIFKEHIQLKSLIASFEKDLKSFTEQVRQVLDSVTTTGRLVEVWPTAEPYIPAHLVEPSKGVNLPILHLSRLDQALGAINGK
jgi:hypothetical protein